MRPVCSGRGLPLSSSGILFGHRKLLCGDEFDELDDEERANLEPLSALGFSMTGEDDHADFTLRLTTK